MVITPVMSNLAQRITATGTYNRGCDSFRSRSVPVAGVVVVAGSSPRCKLCPGVPSSMLPLARALHSSRNGWMQGFRMYARKKGVSVSAPELLASEDDEKAARRADLLKSLNQKFGKGTTWSLNDTPAKVETTPSGCMTLDLAMGGGYPKGRIIEIYGPESTGKSTLALHAIAEVGKLGGIGYYVDVENAFDSEYAQKLGVSEDLMLAQPGCGEDALNIVDEVCRSGVADIIVVDSVSALTPRSEIEGEIGMATMGGQARLMSSALRRICASASKMKCTVIFINQLRSKVGVIYGNPEVTSGGQALKYYASMRIDLRKKEVIEGPSSMTDGKEAIGVKIKAKIVKNKCAPPARVAEFDLLFGSGINALGSMFDLANVLGVIINKGAYYYFESNKLAQGRDKAIAALKADPELLERVETKTKAELASRTAGTAGVVDGAESVSVEDEDVDFEEAEVSAGRL